MKSSEKNITILINSLARGGAENQVKILTEFLDIKNLYILINQNDVKVNKPVPKFLIKKETNSRIVRLIKGIYNLIRFYQPRGIVISFMEQSNFVNIISKLLGNRHGCFISVRISPSYYKEKRFGSLWVFLMKILYPHADLIISNSKDCEIELKSLIKTDPKKIITIPNIICSKPIEQKNIYKFSNDTLITVGRLENQKNIGFQIRLISFFRKNNLPWKLIIVGDGSLKLSLINLAKKLKLRVGLELNNENYDVVFLGLIDDPRSIISKSSIFVLTSFYEGMPNVILEAMSRGAVIVSSNCNTGPKELLSPSEAIKSDQYFYEFGCILPVPSDTKKDLIIWSSLLSIVISQKKIREKYTLQSLKRYEHYKPEKIVPLWENEIYNYF